MDRKFYLLIVSGRRFRLLVDNNCVYFNFNDINNFGSIQSEEISENTESKPKYNSIDDIIKRDKNNNVVFISTKVDRRNWKRKYYKDTITNGKFKPINYEVAEYGDEDVNYIMYTKCVEYASECYYEIYYPNIFNDNNIDTDSKIKNNILNLCKILNIDYQVTHDLLPITITDLSIFDKEKWDIITFDYSTKNIFYNYMNSDSKLYVEGFLEYCYNKENDMVPIGILDGKMVEYYLQLKNDKTLFNQSLPYSEYGQKNYYSLNHFIADVFKRRSGFIFNTKHKIELENFTKEKPGNYLHYYISDKCIDILNKEETYRLSVERPNGYVDWDINVNFIFQDYSKMFNEIKLKKEYKDSKVNDNKSILSWFVHYLFPNKSMLKSEEEYNNFIKIMKGIFESYLIFNEDYNSVFNDNKLYIKESKKCIVDEIKKIRICKLLRICGIINSHIPSINTIKSYNGDYEKYINDNIEVKIIELFNNVDLEFNEFRNVVKNEESKYFIKDKYYFLENELWNRSIFYGKNRYNTTIEMTDLKIDILKEQIIKFKDTLSLPYYNNILSILK